MTSDGPRTFEWDARDQLVAVNVGTHRSEFSYDGLQRRVREVEKENGVVQTDTRVLWCGTGICEERAADGATVTQRASSHGEQIAGTPHSFATDHLGSVRDVTDTNVTPLARYTFDPWGRRTATLGPTTTSVGYTGHQTDTAVGLLLSLYRSYDPELARWTSGDPLGWTEGPNLYQYAANDPIVFADPLGLRITCLTSFHERHVTRTACGTAGCTSIDEFQANVLPCERNPCTNKWEFDAQVTLRLLVEYAVDPNLPSRETPGSTLRQHEMLHVRDLQGWCRGLNNSFKSEGFGSPGACEAARQAFSRSLRGKLWQAINDTGRQCDGK